MATLFKNHYSDECLISHLDGELPFYRDALVRRHLARCWQCRLRLKEIEKQVLDLTQAMREDDFPGSERLVDARLKFLRNAEEIAGEAALVNPAPARKPAVWKWAVAAAGVVLLLGAGWALRRPARPADSGASVAIRQVEMAEQSAGRGPAHQEFRVVVKQVRPSLVASESRLELWADPERGRFTSQLSDTHGRLLQAVWQPAPQRSYVYNRSSEAALIQATRPETRDRGVQLWFREGLTLESLEAGLLKWLEERPWRPISLSSGISYLVTSDGATLRATKLRGDDGRDFLRLSAIKRTGDTSVEFTVEVDAGTHLPRLQCVRYHSPTRDLELWLYPLPTPAVRPASFEPPANLRVAPIAAPLDAPPLPVTAQAPASSPEPDPLSLEVQIYYALHRVQACRGETVEVIHQADGKFLVRGVVVDSDRKDQLTAALAPLAGPQVALDIKSVQEALQEMGPAEVRSARPAAVALPRKDAMRSLASHFSDEEDLARFADQALASSEAVMREAQALRQLAERFYGGREPRSAQARWMLQVMAYDHLRDLQAKLGATEQLVARIAGSASARRPEALPAPAGSPREELQAVFSHSRHLNERLRALLEGNGRVLELLDAFPPLEASVRSATDRALPTSAQKVNAN